jgi:protein ImuB
MFACIYSPQIPTELSLAEFAYAFSPLVEETAPDTTVIDVEGCALRFGSAYELVTQIARAAKAKPPGGLGRRVNVALAANPDAAIYAAKYLKGITFISPGEELDALGELTIEKLISPRSKTKAADRMSALPAEPTLDIGRWTLDDTKADRMSALPAAALPAAALPASTKTLDIGPWTFDKARFEEILETLRLWGVRTFKDFAALPVAGVSERLGQEGLKLQELASGKCQRHLKLRESPPEFNNSIQLEYPIAELEPLAFILARLLNQICAGLTAYALATNALQVAMKLDNGATHEIKLNLPYAMRDHKVFLKLLLLDTEMRPPPASVTTIAISCEPVKPRVSQTGLFIPLAPEPEKLELMLARLGKLVGPQNIGSPELLDTHRPDAFRVKRFELKEPKKKNRKQQSANPPSAMRNPKSILGFRVFRPPLRALVQSEAGCPREISAWDKTKSVHGKVVAAAGPWRTSGDWWRVDGWARDEWDVAVAGRTRGDGEQGSGIVGQVLYRIYRELGGGGWFVEGVYD